MQKNTLLAIARLLSFICLLLRAYILVRVSVLAGFKIRKREIAESDDGESRKLIFIFWNYLEVFSIQLWQLYGY